MSQPDLKGREKEILALMAQGLSNQEIAQQLFLAEKTVRWYNSQIYSKLGVTNREEAVQYAAALGLFHTEKAAATSTTYLPRLPRSSGAKKSWPNSECS